MILVKVSITLIRFTTVFIVFDNFYIIWAYLYEIFDS